MAEQLHPYVVAQSSSKPKIISLVPSDPGSRYKTRQLQIQVIGKSKMIKTMLLNILDVSKDMQVPPTYLGTFFGYEIGAKSSFDEKQPERQQAYLSGEQESKDLSRLTIKFINEVLLCPKCGLPEQNITIEKKEVYGNCRACGAHSVLPLNNDKFRRFIVNHPPTVSEDVFSGNKSNNPKPTNKKGSSDEEQANGSEGNQAGDTNGEENATLPGPSTSSQTDLKSSGSLKKTEEATTPTSKSAGTKTSTGSSKGSSKGSKKSGGSSKGSSSSSKGTKGKQKEESGSDDEKVIWFSDASSDAAKKRREALLPSGNVLSQSSTTLNTSTASLPSTTTTTPASTSTSTTPAGSSVEELEQLLRTRLGAVSAVSKEGEAVVGQVKKECSGNGNSNGSNTTNNNNNTTTSNTGHEAHEAAWASAVVRTAFPVASTSDLKAALKGAAGLLRKGLGLGTSAAAQHHLLRALEAWLLLPRPDSHTAQALLQSTAFVLKELYDLDLVEEAAIIHWHTTLALSDEIKAKAAPFVKWLQEAEEESDADDE